MQKQRLIPTPLLDRSASVVEVDPPRRRELLATFLIIGFVLRLIWQRWASAVVPSLRRGRYRPEVRGRRAREFCERMGGLWIKAGQLIAMRRDFLAPAFCDELSHLQDTAHGFPGAIARGIVERELGVGIDQIFSSWIEAPIAAASIGQVHEARLRESGVRVVVKVQRPDIARQFKRDLRHLRTILFIVKRLNFMPSARWDEMMYELEKTILDELDYRMEGALLRKGRKFLRAHKVYAPKVFEAYTSERVLVMEYLEGVFMSEYIKVANSDPARLAAWCAENDVDPRRFGKRLFFSHMRQLFEDNFFHCDLHPGNILIQRGGRIALIDFGSVGTLDRSALERYQLLFTALAERDYAKAADLFLLSGPSLPHGKDLTEAKIEIIRVCRAWEERTIIKTLPYREKSFTSMITQITEVAGRYQLSPSWAFLRLNRASFTLDASLLQLIPDINYQKMGQQYVDKARRRAMGAMLDRKALLRGLGSMAGVVQLPARLAENAYFDAEWVRRRAMNITGQISKAAYVGRMIFTLLRDLALVAGAILAFAYVQRHVHTVVRGEGRWFHRALAAIPDFDDTTWMLLIGMSLYLFYKFVLLRRRFDEKDSPFAADRR